MKIGFSGTRKGMSVNQKLVLRSLLLRLQPSEFHHGDCLGADLDAHRLVKAISSEGYPKIVIHPPEMQNFRAFCTGDVIHNPAPYLIRNRAIVDETDVLIVAPFQNDEVRRSGTWATARYAMKDGKPVIILMRTELARQEIETK
jgi:hypothetical protein